VHSAGFAINPAKTRLSSNDSRQMVTGLVVNQKVAIPREIYKASRAAVHAILRNKDWSLPRFTDSYRWNCTDESPTTDPFAALEGRLNYLYQTADRSDERELNPKFFNPSAISRTYSDLLYFKYFVKNPRPILVTEGVSDILYIKAALLAAEKIIWFYR
jgi:hypothetical protein